MATEENSQLADMLSKWEQQAHSDEYLQEMRHEEALLKARTIRNAKSLADPTPVVTWWQR